MKQTFTYYPCILPKDTGKMPAANAPDISIEAFENKQYHKALHALLDSIDPNLRNNHTSDKEFTLFHGPLTIHIKTEDEKLHIHAPFLTLPDKNPIAMMRQIASLNFEDLDLAHLHLQDNQIHFRYTCPIALSHPRKIYQVLEEICLTGSRYDYEFRNQFDARRILPPHFTPYPEDTVQYICNVIQKSGHDCLRNLNYFEPSRKFDEMRHLLSVTLLQIMYVAHPQGKLLHTLRKNLQDINRDIPESVIIADGKQALKTLIETPKEELAESLHHTESIIPEKPYIYPSDIREKYNRCYPKATGQLESGEYMEFCLQITQKFYEHLNKFRLPEETYQLLTTALRKTSGQPWEIAASILYETLEALTRQTVKAGSRNPFIAA